MKKLSLLVFVLIILLVAAFEVQAAECKYIYEIDGVTYCIPDQGVDLNTVYSMLHDREAFGVETSRFDAPDVSPHFPLPIYPAPDPFSSTIAAVTDMIQNMVLNSGLMRWLRYMFDLQPNEIEFRRVGGGIFNFNVMKNDGWKAGEVIPLDFDPDVRLNMLMTSSPGNVLVCEHIIRESCLVDGFSVWETPHGDYETNPFYYDVFTSIDRRNGDIGLVGYNRIQTARVFSDPAYMPGNFIKKIDAPPVTATVTASTLSIRACPSTDCPRIGYSYAGDQVKAIDFYVRGSDWWAYYGDGQWSAWAWTNRADTYYFTTWELPQDPPKGERVKQIQPVEDFIGGTVEPEPNEGTYGNSSNQDMINAVYQAAGLLGVDGWSIITRGNMTGLVENRAGLYTMPEIEKNSSLARYEQQLIEDQIINIAGLDANGTYGDVTNQDVINAFYKVAQRHDADFWWWIELYNLEDELAGAYPVRRLVYRYWELEELEPGPAVGAITQEIKQELGQ